MYDLMKDRHLSSSDTDRVVLVEFKLLLKTQSHKMKHNQFVYNPFESLILNLTFHGFHN